MATLVVGPNGVPIITAGLEAVIAEAVAEGQGNYADKIIVVTGPETVASAVLTVPATMTLKIEAGGIITVPNGKQLTIEASFVCGDYKAFACTGTGKVVFGASKPVVRPEWWGAKRNDTAAAATLAAINAAAATSVDAVVQLSPGTYAVNGCINLTDGYKSIIGASPHATIIKTSSNTYGIDWAGTNSGVLRDFTLDASAANVTRVGIYMNRTTTSQSEANMSKTNRMDNVVVKAGTNAELNPINAADYNWFRSSWTNLGTVGIFNGRNPHTVFTNVTAVADRPFVSSVVRCATLPVVTAGVTESVDAAGYDANASLYEGCLFYATDISRSAMQLVAVGYSTFNRCFWSGNEAGHTKTTAAPAILSAACYGSEIHGQIEHYFRPMEFTNNMVNNSIKISMQKQYDGGGQILLSQTGIPCLYENNDIRLWSSSGSGTTYGVEILAAYNDYFWQNNKVVVGGYITLPVKFANPASGSNTKNTQNIEASGLLLKMNNKREDYYWMSAVASGAGVLVGTIAEDVLLFILTVTWQAIGGATATIYENKKWYIPVTNGVAQAATATDAGKAGSTSTLALVQSSTGARTLTLTPTFAGGGTAILSIVVEQYLKE